jgi:hypothetical protein
MSKVIRSIQDAEIAIGQIIDELARMRRTGASSRDLLDYVSKSELESRIQRINFRPAASAPQVISNDTDSNVQNSIVYHNLRHYFRQPILSDAGLILPGDTLTGRWYIKTELNSRMDLVFQYRDPITPANNFDMKLDFAGVATFSGILSPSVTATFDVGNTSLLWRNGYFSSSVQLVATGYSQFRASCYSATTSDSCTLELRRARGTESSPSAVLVNDKLGAWINYAYRNGDWQPSAYFDCYVDSLPGSTAVSSSLYWVSTNSSGVIAYRWRFHPDGHIVPFTNNLYDMGESGKRIRKIWATDIDFSGTITGVLPSTDANTQLNANANANLNLTTTYADISNAIVNLNKNGTWLILGNFVGRKEVNDDEIQGQLVYDGTAQSGIVRMGINSATVITCTGSRSWIVTVTSQPKTAKLQARKATGTGFSTVETINSNIVAVFLTT